MRRFFLYGLSMAGSSTNNQTEYMEEKHYERKITADLK